jgi:HEAT repeat protein
MQPTTQSESLVDGSSDALPVAQVESLLSTLGKTLRAYQMYAANNPVFKGFHDTLRAEFMGLWDQLDALELAVREDGFGYGGHVVTVGQGRDSLAFAFYKDGIRYLKFLPGFEAELPAFLEAVLRARKREDDADDMISVLWEEDFGSFQYGYVDLLTEGLALPESAQMEPGDLGGSPAELEAVDEEAAEGGEPGQAAASLAAGLSRDDFDETLYFLDQAEMSALRTAVQVEMERDLRRDVLNALFDRLDDPGQPERKIEIMGILDQLLPLFLSRGDMVSAAKVLDELDKLTESDSIDPALMERIDRLFKRLGDPEVLEQFVQALEDGAVSPDSDEVTLFFSRLHAEALPTLLRFSEMSEKPGVRDRLASAIDGLAARYPSEVESLLSSSEPALVKGAARAAGRVGLSQTMKGLQEALSHPDRDVRVSVVHALASIRLTPALQALTIALRDEDREVRIAAAKALGMVRFASARDALGAALDDRRLKDADLTEKMAFYEAYGAVGGNVAVERLDRVLNEKGFLGRRAPSDLRACAALGLGRVGSPAARAALQKAQSDEDPVVRTAVVRALKQEEGQE